MEHEIDKKTNKFNVLLIFVLIAVVLIGIFQKDIRVYYRKRQLIKTSSTMFIEMTHHVCYTMVERAKEGLVEGTTEEDAIDLCNLYASTKRRDRTLSLSPAELDEYYKDKIRKNKDIDCNEFAYQEEAQDFYEFLGALFKDRIIEDIDRGKCYYDPYNLDEDNDCYACEVLPHDPRQAEYAKEELEYIEKLRKEVSN